MSEYRDDSTDTAIASDSTFGGLRSVLEDIVRVSDALLFGLAITLSSSAIASDEVIDATTYTSVDSAIVSDEFTDRVHASQSSSDTLKASDSLYYGLRTIHTDTANLSGEVVTGSVSALLTDTAIASDSATGQRLVSTLVTDSAIVSDELTRRVTDLSVDNALASDSVIDRLIAVQVISDTAIASDSLMESTSALLTDTASVSDEVVARRYVGTLVEDTATASDSLPYNRIDIITDTAIADSGAYGVLHARDLITDSAAITDSISDKTVQSNIIIDSAKVANSVIDRLHATVIWTDTVVVQDEIVSIGGYHGQTWTTNTDSWAMSRYEPYNFKRLVVINGVLYGEADDGIYQLNQEVYPVSASVQTGKIDLSGGQLTHPSSAYLEYELIGQASMTVSSTQKGVQQSYTYVLPSELAGELTNGRFIFGRGLRGRHFSFELTMVGTHGFINDLTVEHEPTSRRV